jgi:hypothetical protein
MWKHIWSVEVRLQALQTATLDEGAWTASPFGRITIAEKVYATNIIGRSVRPEANVNLKEKIKIPPGISKRNFSAQSQLFHLFTAAHKEGRFDTVLN